MIKEPELQIKTSFKNAGTFIKLVLGAVSALGMGAAGSVIASNSDASEQDVRIEQVEQACQRYDVRLATTEAKMQAYEVNLIDIKKDLAEIRSTNTQILFILRSEK
jgi:hypothetical protein